MIIRTKKKEQKDKGQRRGKEKGTICSIGHQKQAHTQRKTHEKNMEPVERITISILLDVMMNRMPERVRARARECWIQRDCDSTRARARSSDRASFQSDKMHRPYTPDMILVQRLARARARALSLSRSLALSLSFSLTHQL